MTLPQPRGSILGPLGKRSGVARGERQPRSARQRERIVERLRDAGCHRCLNLERRDATERRGDPLGHKIAASKARGMWMGGTPPLGYAPDGRTLAIVEDHAVVIRHLFERYLVLRNVRLVEEELQRERITLPVRQRISGLTHGGGQFSRGQIYKILSNPIYIGRIPHRQISHVGLHPAIVSTETWDLAQNLRGERTRVRAASPSLLAGRIRGCARR